MAEALRWSDMVIDLAEGDPARGGYIRWISLGVGIRAALHGPLGAGLHRVARRLQPCRRDGPRCRSDITGSGHHLHLQSNAIACGVIVADDAALRDIDEALQSAKRSADDIALGFALYTKANALLHRDSAQRERGIGPMQAAS